MASCKTIVAGELFQAARQPKPARLRWNGVPSLTSLWSANRRAGYGDSTTTISGPVPGAPLSDRVPGLAIRRSANWMAAIKTTHQIHRFPATSPLIGFPVQRSDL